MTTDQSLRTPLDNKCLTGFRKCLIRWYKQNARNLPWRKTTDPYKIWISEVMLQQTTVSAVIGYYQRWIKVFPTVGSVAEASLGKILRAWQGLGYYQRAKNIHRSARMIHKLYGGTLVADFETLKSLPGFGPYITSAVLSIAFNKKYPLIDANVRRVMMRLRLLKGHADAIQDKNILDFLKKLLPDKEVGIFNQALMELGALICRSKEPSCLVCPVRDFCLAYKKELQEVIPQPRRRIVQKIEAVAGIIKKDGCYFIQRRPSKGLLADLWEFPGGKIKRGESSKESLRRELKEELGVSLVSAKYLATIRHFYTKFQVRLQAWLCEVKPLPLQDKTHKWVPFRKLDRYPMPSGSVKIVGKLS